MKLTKSIRTFNMVFASLLVCGSLFFFASNSTLEKADQEAIKDLYVEMESMSQELAQLKEINQESNLDVLANPSLGEIRMFAGNFAPRGWAFCEGQLLPISPNTALFSLLGTTYGGDGRTTFGLPDLRGRAPIGAGTGPGLPAYNLGQRGGTYDTSLSFGSTSAQAAPAQGREKVPVVSDVSYPHAPFTNMQPYLAVRYIVCISGLYPSRS